nr:hypothetical protein [Tanacetum cinerariifolium]
MDQNIDFSGFDQIQSPQYPVNHHISQAYVEEVLQDNEKFMQDTQTILKKFNRFSFEFIPTVLTIAWERIDKIKYVLTEPEEIPELMYKLREDVQNIREELAEYIDSLIWNCPIFFYDEDEEYTIQYREYLEKYPDAVTTVLPTEEPEYSLSMGYEHLSTTLETELDEVTESSAKNLLPIPSEYAVTSEDESECDMPAKDESFSIDSHCFNVESDLIESLLNRDTFIDSSPKFDFLLNEFYGDLTHINPILPEIKEADFELEEEIRFVENFLYDNSSPRLPEELNVENAYMIVESLPSSLIPVQDNDSQREEIEIVTDTDELLPPGFENDDSEGEIYVLEELRVDNSILSSENELSDNEASDFDDPSFPRPPPEPPDVEFDFEPNSGEVIAAVMNDIEELIDDECFDSGGDIDVFTNVEDDDYFPFMLVIRIFLPYLIYPEVFPLLLSAKSEDTIFDP